jgi:hypothetical protein
MIDEAEESIRGRASKFEDIFVHQAKLLARRGADDNELAEFFDVSVRTIFNWRRAYPEFAEATKVGRADADDRVERSLYERAVGYRYTEQQAIKVKVEKDREKVEIVEVEKMMPPDTNAAQFWMKNRRPADWRDRREQVITGRVEHVTDPGEARAIIEKHKRRAIEGPLIELTAENSDTISD